jgi:hypothetical protein
MNRRKKKSYARCHPVMFMMAEGPFLTVVEIVIYFHCTKDFCMYRRDLLGESGLQNERAIIT